MVMILKLGMNQKEVKGFSPIVLTQIVGKLSDKVIANLLQTIDIFT